MRRISKFQLERIPEVVPDYAKQETVNRFTPGTGGTASWKADKNGFVSISGAGQNTATGYAGMAVYMNGITVSSIHHAQVNYAGSTVMVTKIFRICKGDTVSVGFAAAQYGNKYCYFIPAKVVYNRLADGGGYYVRAVKTFLSSLIGGGRHDTDHQVAARQPDKYREEIDKRREGVLRISGRNKSDNCVNAYNRWGRHMDGNGRRVFVADAKTGQSPIRRSLDTYKQREGIHTVWARGYVFDPINSRTQRGDGNPACRIGIAGLLWICELLSGKGEALRYIASLLRGGGICHYRQFVPEGW